MADYSKLRALLGMASKSLPESAPSGQTLMRAAGNDVADMATQMKYGKTDASDAANRISQSVANRLGKQPTAAQMEEMNNFYKKPSGVTNIIDDTTPTEALTNPDKKAAAVMANQDYMKASQPQKYNFSQDTKLNNALNISPEQYEATVNPDPSKDLSDPDHPYHGVYTALKGILGG